MKVTVVPGPSPRNMGAKLSEQLVLAHLPVNTFVWTVPHRRLGVTPVITYVLCTSQYGVWALVPLGLNIVLHTEGKP